RRGGGAQPHKAGSARGLLGGGGRTAQGARFRACGASRDHLAVGARGRRGDQVVAARGAERQLGEGPFAVKRSLLAVIAAYRRWVSPAIGRRCKYEPSCSVYAGTA